MNMTRMYGPGGAMGWLAEWDGFRVSINGATVGETLQVACSIQRPGYEAAPTLRERFAKL